MEYLLIKPSWLKAFADKLRQVTGRLSDLYRVNEMTTAIANINNQRLPYGHFKRIYEEGDSTVTDGIVRMPEGIETVAGSYLFYNATHMVKLILPKTLKKFSGDDGTIFAGCENLHEIIFLGEFSANLKINFEEIDRYCNSQPQVYVLPEFYEEFIYQGASNGFNSDRVHPLNRGIYR